MPLQLPNLDNRTYNDLVSEAIAMIPRYAPTWTNYNASDPGITLIELLAYFSEMLIYRLDRIGRENKINFLRLLVGTDAIDDSEAQTWPLEVLEQRLQQAVLALKERQRAVTCDDYEYLAKQAALNICGERSAIRVCCVDGKNLSANGAERDASYLGHISLIVAADRNKIPLPYDRMLQKVRDELEPKRLLTTRLHVVKPCYVWLALSLVVHPEADADWETVKKAVVEKIGATFDPVTGGTDQLGWPFGRNLYLSDIAAAVEQIAGVDYLDETVVRCLSLAKNDLYSGQAVVGIQIGVSSTVGVDTLLGTKLSDSQRLLSDGTGKIAGILLKPYELLQIAVREQDISRAGFVDSTGP